MPKVKKYFASKNIGTKKTLIFNTKLIHSTTGRNIRVTRYTNFTSSRTEPEADPGGGTRGHGPPPNRWIINVGLRL